MGEILLTEAERRDLHKASKELQTEFRENHEKILNLSEFKKLLNDFSEATINFAKSGRDWVPTDDEMSDLIDRYTKTEGEILEAYELALSKIK